MWHTNVPLVYIVQDLLFVNGKGANINIEFGSCKQESSFKCHFIAILNILNHLLVPHKKMNPKLMTNCHVKMH
jgi:hypothetical protein